MTSTICINGKTITISGNGNIIVSDNKVIVDGITVCSNEQHLMLPLKETADQ